MKKILLIIFIAIAFLGNFNISSAEFLDPIQTQAVQEDYSLLAPIPGVNKIDNTNTLGTYLNFFFKFAISVCAGLAVLMIVIYGVQYMGDGSVFGHTEAKSKIGSAIMGLLLALGAYALLNTINPDLVGSNGIKIKQVTIKLQSMDIPQEVQKDGTYVGTTYKKGEIWPDDQKTRDDLKKINISVSPTKCTTVGQSGCTTVYGLNTAFVSKLKTTCPTCDITITEGTGFWKHIANVYKIHYPGGWTVDMRQTTTLSTFIHSKPKTPFSWGICYDIGNGLGIVEEKDHFHAFSLTGGCNTSKQGV